MMLAHKGYQTFGKSYETYAKGALIDYWLYGVVALEAAAAVPQFRHQQRELLHKGCLLEVVAFAQLLCRHFEHIIEFGKECIDALLLVFYFAALEGEFHYIDGRERQVTAAHRGLFAKSVLKHACAASHCGYFIFIALGVVGSPLFVIVIGGIEIHKVGEEAAGGHLACQLIQVVVAVFGKITYAFLLFPNLYREDGCSAVAHTFVGGIEQFTYDAASFGRCVGTVVYRTKHHLVTSTRMNGVHVVNKCFHRLVHACHGAIDGVLQHSFIAGQTVQVFGDVVVYLDII